MNYRKLILIFGFLVLCLPTSVLAGGTESISQVSPLPIPGSGSLAPIPHPLVLRPSVAHNVLLPSVPQTAMEADAQDLAQQQEAPGRGIHQQPSRIGQGNLLLDVEGTCNDFNRSELWASTRGEGGIWSDHYAGWIPFAVNSSFYRAANVVFSYERIVGPGGDEEELSAKIASMQPYAAGIGSPLIAAPAGAPVLVQVDYLIWDHDTRGQDMDWVSLGIKPDVFAAEATYVNGLRRGRWSQLTHQVTAGPSGVIMVLVQAESPMPLNSVIYFDNIRIAVDGRYIDQCLVE